MCRRCQRRLLPQQRPPPCSLGTVDLSTVQKVKVEVTDEEKARLERIANRPPLSEILNLHDFEVGRMFALEGNAVILSVTQAIAKVVMPDKAWAYYSSAAEDEITNRENHAAYHR